jgi:hypothetical protein
MPLLLLGSPPATRSYGAQKSEDPMQVVLQTAATCSVGSAGTLEQQRGASLWQLLADLGPWEVSWSLSQSLRVLGLRRVWYQVAPGKTDILEDERKVSNVREKSDSSILELKLGIQLNCLRHFQAPSPEGQAPSAQADS